MGGVLYLPGLSGEYYPRSRANLSCGNKTIKPRGANRAGAGVNNWGSKGAVTLGSYISGSRELEADPNNPLFQHEYGHYLQSQSMGWAYLPRIGIPSIFSASKKDGNHDFQPFEQDANRRAFMYFNENVEGFYKSFEDRNANRGWNFTDNPLDVYHKGQDSRWDYYDYHNPEHRALINSLALKAKWYDYFEPPFGLIIGTVNGLYYNKHRVK